MRTGLESSYRVLRPVFHLFFLITSSDQSVGESHMFSTALSAGIDGMESRKVTVEADVSDGLPTFTMVGYLASETREASERVRSALRNSGLLLGVRHITVNLAPASLHKQGSSFDLAIAVALLIASDHLSKEAADGILFIGELGLSGRLNPVRGVLEIVSHAASFGCSMVIVPRQNLSEGSVISGTQVFGAENLVQVVGFLASRTGNLRLLKELDLRLMGDLNPGTLYQETIDLSEIRMIQKEQQKHDFSEIRGQKLLRRAAEVAVSGFHNLLMIGPPGAGKTLTAHCLSTIMPEMTDEEILEVSKIHSIAGTLPAEGLVTVRPYRNPHHTITKAALCGGGMPPVPGEVSLAHRGILFLDEFPEFDRSVIDTLRQPLEERVIRIARVSGNFTFPAGFMLVASMNPCPCGYFPDRSRCSCKASEVRRYLSKISMPLLDRIDLCVEARRIEYEELTSCPPEESSASIRRRVTKAIAIQERRYRGTPFRFNSDLTSDGVKEFCKLSNEEESFMGGIYDSMSLTARSYFRILKVARTIADLAGEQRILPEHLAEAVSFRAVDRKYWEDALEN